MHKRKNASKVVYGAESYILINHKLLSSFRTIYWWIMHNKMCGKKCINFDLVLNNSFGLDKSFGHIHRHIKDTFWKLTVHQDSRSVVSVGFLQGDNRKSHGFVLQGMGSCLEWIFPTWSLQMPTKQDINR